MIFEYLSILKTVSIFQDCAEARKNTLLYHFNAMNVVKRIQNILKSKVLNDDESTKYEEFQFSSEEIHKVKYLDFKILVGTS